MEAEVLHSGSFKDEINWFYIPTNVTNVTKEAIRGQSQVLQPKNIYIYLSRSLHNNKPDHMDHSPDNKHPTSPSTPSFRHRHLLTPFHLPRSSRNHLSAQGSPAGRAALRAAGTRAGISSTGGSSSGAGRGSSNSDLSGRGNDSAQGCGSGRGLDSCGRGNLGGSAGGAGSSRGA